MADLLVRIESDERKSDTPDKSGVCLHEQDEPFVSINGFAVKPPLLMSS